MKDDIIDLLVAAAPLAAVLLATLTLVIQYRLFHKERKPIVMPVTREFTDQFLPNLIYDWESEEKIDKSFSDTEITLTNYGGTTANIESYNYFFKNFEDIRKELDRLSDDETALMMKRLERPESFSLDVQSEAADMWFHEINSIVKRGNILRVDEELDIYLPSYFMVISNFLLKEIGFKVLPELTLRIRYSDIDKNEKTQDFSIKWDSSRRVVHKKEGALLTGALVIKLEREFKSK